MTYYITGSSGFIGSAICEYLEAKGERVISRCRSLIYGDGGEFDFEGIDIIINCQSYGNHYWQKNNPNVLIDSVMKCNIEDLRKMLIQAKKQNIRKFYNLSSSSVQLKEQTLYSASKLLGEQFVKWFNNPNFINIRPYSVFGPGEANHRFIPTVIRCLETGERMNLDPNPKHDWIFIQDFIEAMFSGYTEIGTGESYSNLEIVSMLQEISGKRLNFDIVEGLRSYDCEEWKASEGVPHIPIYEALKITYDTIRTKNY